jgi:predicted RNA-binding Zn ribbon-like protein
MVSSTNLSAAPHGLDLVIDFVNTRDLEAGTDVLACGDDLAAWMAEHRLTAAAPTDADHRHALDLREALRTLMQANNGASPDDRAGRELEQAARRGELGVHFSGTGETSLEPSRDDFDGALARLLVPVVHATADGSWSRAKACRVDDCRWAFYDRSRNRSGVWCDMAVCGNRTKVRAYRRRTPRDAG